ncbi:transcription factor HES-5-like [Bombina bombina]|uniref:transcription factor HES-5-like n=1 Tax=Bombina bombina TaxID=8345 RepID=UPI00235AB2C1|nr:transcription factor HES-5-like [Bombina bombina]
MAPCILTMKSAHCNSEGKILRKLKKPVIEKMRRDRINSSIEQLRILLEKEFQKQQLPSKPEKADILEMTVSFLQQHLAAKSAPSPSQSYREGHSRCLQDSLNFLSLQTQPETEVNLLHHIQKAQSLSEDVCFVMMSHSPIPSKHTALLSTRNIWRPWQ